MIAFLKNRKLRQTIDNRDADELVRAYGGGARARALELAAKFDKGTREGTALVARRQNHRATLIAGAPSRDYRNKKGAGTGMVQRLFHTERMAPRVGFEPTAK